MKLVSVKMRTDIPSLRLQVYNHTDSKIWNTTVSSIFNLDNALVNSNILDFIRKSL